MINPLALAGKHIILTGGSSGIGRGTAIMLSRLGARMTLIARNEAALAETMSCLDGDGHAIRVYDFSHREGISELISEIVRVQGKADGMAYCAGVEGIYPLKLLYPERLDEIMTINVLSFVELVRVLASKRNHNPSSSFVGISSVASTQGARGKTAYCISKAAMDGAVRALAHELASTGLRLNTVAPGWIETDMYNRYRAASPDITTETVLERQYLGLGKPEDIANAVAFLLSDASRLITGTQLVVDGGYLS